MFSVRFNRPVVLTRHALQRMAERDVAAALVLELVDHGNLLYSDPQRLWAWMHVSGREDNLLCVALVLDQAVVVKTVMHRWELEP